MEGTSYAQLIEESIKLHFERNGILDEMRSGLHVKVLQLMRGESDKKDAPLCGGDMKHRGLLQLLNYLVVDYFAWYGYKHTMETFALETGDKYLMKPREKLQREFNTSFEHKDLPILLQMVMKQVKKGQGEGQETEKLNRKLNAISTDIPPEGHPNKSKSSTPTKVLPKNTQSADTPKEGVKLNQMNPLRSVKVRQSMAETIGKTPSPTCPKRVIKKKKPSSDYESSSGTLTESGSDVEPSSNEDSDAFAEIPNRYYYREQEPPEQAYANGYGEEGLYESPGTSRRQVTTKREALKIVELPMDEDEEKPACSQRPKATTKRIVKKDEAFQSAIAKTMLKSQAESMLNSPAGAKCPETFVCSMQDTSEESDEGSGEYI